MGRQITIDDGDVFWGYLYDLLVKMEVSLTSIRGYSNLSYELWRPEFLDVISKHSEICHDLRNIIEDYLRVKTHNLSQHLDEFDIVTVIKAIFDNAQSHMDEKGILSKIEILGQSPTYILQNKWHIEERLRMVLRDIIQNCKDGDSLLVEYNTIDDKMWYVRFIKSNPLANSFNSISNFPRFFVLDAHVKQMGGNVDVLTHYPISSQCTITLPIRYVAPTSENVD